MTFRAITHADQAEFHRLLNAYYREGEDADTQQAEIDQFIDYLFNLCIQGKISGAIVRDNGPQGFVLWMIDAEGSEFSNWPGRGTILEIGVVPEYRRDGLGRSLADYAEAQMRGSGTDSFYVCAYGPAESFWTGCGYSDSGRIAENGLKIYSKNI